MITYGSKEISFSFGVPWGITMGYFAKQVNDISAEKEYAVPQKEDAEMSLLIAIKRENYAILMSESRAVFRTVENGKEILTLKSDTCRKIIQIGNHVIGFTGLYDFAEGYIEDILGTALLPEDPPATAFHKIMLLHQQLQPQLIHTKLDLTYAGTDGRNVLVRCISGNSQEQNMVTLHADQYIGTGISFAPDDYLLPLVSDQAADIAFAKNFLEKEISVHQKYERFSMIGGPLQGYLLDKNGVQKIF